MGHNGTNNKKPRFVLSPNTITKIIVMIICILIASLLFGCKSSRANVITAKDTDTLHVYHTDTVQVFRTDSIRVIKEVIVRDSIATTIKEVYYINIETGDTIRSEKEVSRDSWHGNDTKALFLQHTMDSIIRAKADSTVRASYNEKPVVMKMGENKPWYKKALNTITSHVAGIMIASMLAFMIYFLGTRKK